MLPYLECDWYQLVKHGGAVCALQQGGLQEHSKWNGRLVCTGYAQSTYSILTPFISTQKKHYSKHDHCRQGSSMLYFISLRNKTKSVTNKFIVKVTKTVLLNLATGVLCVTLCLRQGASLVAVEKKLYLICSVSPPIPQNKQQQGVNNPHETLNATAGHYSQKYFLNNQSRIQTHSNCWHT